MMRAKDFLFEYKRDITKKQLGDRLVAANRNDNQTDIDNILATLEKIDPTPNKQYVVWLANQYIQGLFRLEDALRVNDVLQKFIQVKSRLPVKDIGQYTFHTLEDKMDEIFNVELQNKPEEQSTFEVPNGTEVLYNGPLGLLAIPKTFEASKILGSGTKWCTTSEPHYFTSYSKKGPLYIWRDKNGDKYQFHFPSSQFMDSRDRSITRKLWKYFRTEHPILKKLFKKGEEVFMRTAPDAFAYAKNFIKGRFTEAEPVIMKHSAYAYWYAVDVIKGRWKEAEPYIMKSPGYALDYAVNFIKGRWKEAEPYIMEDPHYAYRYARGVIEGRWKEAEPYIMEDPEYACRYARDVIKGRWKEAEPYIMKDPNSAAEYAADVIKGRWKEAERYIKKDPETWAWYQERF